MADFKLSGFADEASMHLDEQIEVLRAAGMRYVEMRNVDGGNLIDAGDQKVAEIKEKLKTGGIALSAVGSYIGKYGIADEFQPHLDAFKRGMDVAKMLDAPNIRIFSFFIPEGDDPAIYRDEVMERMSRFLDYADGSGVNICHENEKGIYGDTPERVLDLHRTLGSRLKGIFDPANYIQCDVCDMPTAMRPLLPYIEYLHIKDARLATGKVTPAGLGDGRLPEVIDAFAGIHPDGFLSVEPHLQVFAGFDKLGDTASISGEYTYASGSEAFLAAANALKGILDARGR